MSEITRSLDQERAAYAWSRLKDPPSKEYVALAKGAPALIMSNGLMQTLAFYRSKRAMHHCKLLADLYGWLGQRRLVGDLSFDAVMQTLHGSDSNQYLLATEEALAILRWIRQFADARKEN